LDLLFLETREEYRTKLINQEDVTDFVLVFFLE